MANITVVADHTTHAEGRVDAHQAVVAADALQQLLGWELKPEGLCRDDTCIPVADRSVFETDGAVDLVGVAGVLGRPTLVDAESASVAIGAPANERHKALRERRAPDFTLPDLEGVPQTLSGWTGKKRLLVCFASW